MKKLLVIGIAALILSCDDEDVWDCVQKSGETIIYEIPSDTIITKIKVFDDINVVLHSADSQKLEIHTGENLIPDIDFLGDTGVVHVFNRNVCRWTRSPNNIELHIYGSELNFIQKEGYGTITNKDTLYHRVSFVTYGPGEINLVLNNPRISFQLYSLTNVNLSGFTNSLGCYINTARDPILNARDLRANNVSVTHDGFNDAIVFPVSRLNYRIWNSGNIIVLNEPETINEVEKTGTGKLIKNY